MTAADYTAPVEVIPEPTHATFYAWAVEWADGGVYLASTTPGSGTDPIEYARLNDPRKRDHGTDARAALVKITVPLSELRRL